jgi:ABC-2 type transport system permease protein
VQASFPVFFITLFLSSAFFPRNLMHGWFRAAAGVNPLSWMIEGLRNLVIRGFAFRYVAESLAVAAALAVLSIAVSSLALRRRLRVVS